MMMKVLLDTHAFMWYVNESPNLTSTAKRVIDDAEQLLVSAISAWEIGLLVSRGRLRLVYDVHEFIRLSHNLHKIKWLAVDPEVAVSSTRLTGQIHKDPADRIIAATAMSLGIPLISADKRLQQYDQLRTIW